jgi:Zn-finger nucleic acid-binding protein
MNEEKDRYGDFIRLLERAREDVFFAEKDREILDKLKRKLERVQRSQLENPTLNCPRCGTALHGSSLLDFPVSRCAACGGIWLDRAVLPEFVKLGPPRSADKSVSCENALRGARQEANHLLGKI